MTTIRQHAEQYLAMRRALGFKLTTFGQRLLSFVSYLESRGQHVVTTEAAVAWAVDTPRGTDQVHWSRRLMVVRIFARHLAALDPAHEIPPEDILPHHYRRITPHLFTPDQITALLDATDALRPALRALTYRTLIGLLAVTGMRDGEAFQLDRADVDLDDGMLTIQDSKFGKSRQVPIHDTTVAALRRYAQRRDEICPTPKAPAFFVSTLPLPKTSSVQVTQRARTRGGCRRGDRVFVRRGGLSCPGRRPARATGTAGVRSRCPGVGGVGCRTVRTRAGRGAGAADSR
jgi:integrase/recombinase XerD